MTLLECADNIGQPVVYSPPGQPNKDSGAISHIEGSYVFVVYAGDSTAKATKPADLRLDR